MKGLLLKKELKALNESYDAGFFEKLAKLESHSFWFCARNKLIVWALRRYFPKAKSIFEIGCGTGFVLSGVKREFPHLLLYGSDIYVKGLDFAKSRLGDAELFHMDARKIHFREKFDVIGAFDILEHIEEDAAVLSQMCNATRNGGGVILAVPQHKFLFSQADRDARHVRRYTRQELKKKVENAGFKVTDTFSFVSLLFSIMAISRLKNRKSNKKYSVLSELQPHKFANAIFEKVLDFERNLIRQGIRLPFGGSLFLVAHKT